MMNPVRLNILEFRDDLAEVGKNCFDERGRADAVDRVSDAVLNRPHGKVEVFRLECRRVNEGDRRTRKNDRRAEQHLASGGRMRNMLLNDPVKVMDGFRRVRDNFDFHCGFYFVVSFLTRSL